MTQSMSDDAQAARAKKAQENLAKAHATDTKRASELADALAPIDPQPVARAHITETHPTPAESCIDRSLEVLDETRLQPKDSPVDLYATPRRESPIEDLRTQAIDELRQLLAAADARNVAQDAEIRRLRAALQQLSSGLHP